MTRKRAAIFSLLGSLAITGGAAASLQLESPVILRNLAAAALMPGFLTDLLLNGPHGGSEGVGATLTFGVSAAAWFVLFYMVAWFHRVSKAKRTPKT